MHDADYASHEMRYYWESRYLSGLSDEAIDVLVKLNEPLPPRTLDPRVCSRPDA